MGLCHTIGGPLGGQVVGNPCSSDLPLRCGPRKPGQSANFFCIGDSGGAGDRNVCPTNVTTGVSVTRIAGNIALRMIGRLWMSRCYNKAYRPRQGNDDVVFKRQADSESEAGRLSLQRLRGRGEEKEKPLQSEEG